MLAIIGPVVLIAIVVWLLCLLPVDALFKKLFLGIGIILAVIHLLKTMPKF